MKQTIVVAARDIIWKFGKDQFIEVIFLEDHQVCDAQVCGISSDSALLAKMKTIYSSRIHYYLDNVYCNLNMSNEALLYLLPCLR